MRTASWVAIVVVAVVVGAIVVASSLDGIVKSGVETFGSQVAKVSIKLDSVHIGLLTGSAKVSGLVVGNPEGYKTPEAISVGVAEVGINPFSLLSDKIVVRTIHVVSPEITFEGGLGGNNLGKISQNVNAFTKTGAAPSTNAPAKTAGQPGKRIEVDDFLITGARVHVNLTGMEGKETTLSLPNIHLTDLGKGSDGLTPADLARAMLSAITSATVKAVAGNASELGKGAENLGKDTAKEAAQEADRIKKKIGGLFGK